ncbi:unnamed protein product [Prunus armeniaca]|uniref:Uncharacterized protein n=1 Tax=Prunus armeniaca TaxID=36596 RepID=A0A6J5VJJ3_PRUAR|nr:unnamed protein product [Prunus armeniaca]
MSGNSHRELLLLLEAGSDGVLNHDVRFVGFVCAFRKTVRGEKGVQLRKENPTETGVREMKW